MARSICHNILYYIYIYILYMSYLDWTDESKIPDVYQFTPQIIGFIAFYNKETYRWSKTGNAYNTEITAVFMARNSENIGIPRAGKSYLYVGNEGQDSASYLMENGYLELPHMNVSIGKYKSYNINDGDFGSYSVHAGEYFRFTYNFNGNYWIAEEIPPILTIQEMETLLDSFNIDSSIIKNTIINTSILNSQFYNFTNSNLPNTTKRFIRHSILGLLFNNNPSKTHFYMPKQNLGLNGTGNIVVVKPQSQILSIEGNEDSYYINIYEINSSITIKNEQSENEITITKILPETYTIFDGTTTTTYSDGTTALFFDSQYKITFGGVFFEPNNTTICYSGKSLAHVQDKETLKESFCEVENINISKHLIFSFTRNKFVPILVKHITKETNKFILLKKNLLGENKPSEDLYITSKHPIIVEDKEIIARKINGSEKVISHKQKIYTLVTDEREALSINNLHILSWKYSDYLQNIKKW
jgi:hypothetical protein